VMMMTMMMMMMMLAAAWWATEDRLMSESAGGGAEKGRETEWLQLILGGGRAGWAGNGTTLSQPAFLRSLPRTTWAGLAAKPRRNFAASRPFPCSS
jgi:hypothetical protein